MKKSTILTKTLSIISCAALLYVTFTNQARAGDCAKDMGITPAVAKVDCKCQDGLQPNGCGGPQITPFAGYHTCLPLSDSGYRSCKDDSQVEYYDSTPCVASYNFWGMAGCYAAELAGGIGSIAACISPLGVFTGGASCYAAISASVAAGGIACHFCATHDCAASATGIYREMRTPSEPDSSSWRCSSSG